MNEKELVEAAVSCLTNAAREDAVLQAGQQVAPFLLVLTLFLRFALKKMNK